MLVEHSLAPWSYAEARARIGRGARSLLHSRLCKAGLTHADLTVDHLHSQFIHRYRAQIAAESRPYPGVVRALRELTELGAKLVVCTNKPTDLAIRLLSALKLARFFDVVVGPDMVSAMKPDAAHLIETVKLAGGDIARTVLIGDAEPDAMCAKAAGVPFVMVTGGYLEALDPDLQSNVIVDTFDIIPSACVALLT